MNVVHLPKSGSQPVSHSKPLGELSVDGLAIELRDAEWRRQRFFEVLAQADRAIIMIGCDDSREDVPIAMEPGELLRVGDKTLGFLFVPVIGGGSPEAALLKAAYEECRAHGIAGERLSILATQHGSTAEVSMALIPGGGLMANNITCGARKAALSRGSGLPADLQEIICRQDASMLGNISRTRQGVEGLLRDNDIPCRVEMAYYDHELKTIHMLDENGRQLGTTPPINTGLSCWRDSFQDPRVTVLSYGPKAASTPHGVAFPATVGTKGNNDFSAAAADEAGLLRALAEIEYPLLNKLDCCRGASHGGNFEHLDAVVVLVDDKAHALDFKRVLATKETLNRMLRESLGGLFLCRLSDGDVQYISAKIHDS